MEETFYELDEQTIAECNVFENQEETEDEMELLIEIVNDSDLYIIIENYIDVINEIAETDSNFSEFLTNRMNEQDIINLEKAVYQKSLGVVINKFKTDEVNNWNELITDTQKVIDDYYKELEIDKEIAHLN